MQAKNIQPLLVLFYGNDSLHIVDSDVEISPVGKMTCSIDRVDGTAVDDNEREGHRDGLEENEELDSN